MAKEKPVIVYHAIEFVNLPKLNEGVNLMLKDGWSVQGGISTRVEPSTEIAYYCQSLIK